VSAESGEAPGRQGARGRNTASLSTEAQRWATR